MLVTLVSAGVWRFPHRFLTPPSPPHCLGGKKASGVTYRSIGDHTEVVAVEFNPSVLSYEDILAWFWSCEPLAVSLA